MISIRHQVSLAETRPVPITPRPLADAVPQPRPNGTSTSRAFTHFFANAQQNGRIGVALPPGGWRVRWRVPAASAPVSVLSTDDRVLVQSAGWQLLDGNGRTVAEGARGPASAIVDSVSGMMYLINPASYLEARSLKNGDLVFQSPLLTNERFSWPLIARFGPRLLLAGVEQPMASHAPRPGTQSEIDMLELEPALHVDEYKQILSLKRSEILHFDRAKMVFAAANDKVYAAAPGYLVVARSGLEVDAVYQGDFVPRSISVDESGYMYLIVESAGKTMFWVVTPEGKRVVQTTLANEHQTVTRPAVVAHNHQSYLVAGANIVAYSGATPRWQHTMPGEITGAVITLDDKLLVSAGSEIGIFDGEGHQIGRHHFEGERVTTAAALVQAGGVTELRIATASHVYGLIPQ